MKNKTVRQFKTVKEIEAFLEKKDSGVLDNTWENVCDEFNDFDNPEKCVKEFNKAMKNFAKLLK